MNFLNLGKYLSFFILIISGVVYVIGDPLQKLISYQGPIIGGAILGWYVMNSSTPKDKFVDLDGTQMPIASLLLRKRSWIGFVIFSFLVIPWLTPLAFRAVETNAAISILAYASELSGGFIAGYFISSLKFMEKVVLYSLAFAGDLFYVIVLYIFSQIYGLPETVLVDNVLGYVYGIKFSEGVIFAVYVIKKINAI
ncbi:hypothetical protein [Acidianus brierleyi]|uniref:DUF1404 domain-containing protein n=1 Tax=Acidianus brierleyi TaxID=41673 RepID=A0A2U9IBJ7_9CREN|nr:hypothetical protein [Acidianus brierleyi]AWR93374.1 hypothetical protein DFR85_00875 [Acidianus brierleyi]